MGELQNRDPELLVAGGNRLGFYEREFYPLSNFSSFQIIYMNLWFPTSEHLYHWFKFHKTAPVIAEHIRHANSAHEAFVLAQRHKDLREPNWDDIKVDVMEEVLWLKYEQHEYVRRKLLATYPYELIEDSPKDDFWGWGPNKDGENQLGKLWMKMRNDIIERNCDCITGKDIGMPEYASRIAQVGITCVNPRHLALQG